MSVTIAEGASPCLHNGYGFSLGSGEGIGSGFGRTTIEAVKRDAAN